MRLLFVCTGNVCRSPVAEGLTKAWLSQNGGVERQRVEVLSAGTDAPVGRPMDPASAAALARLGGDPAGLRARALTAEIASAADLVLAMTRGHRRTVLELAPRGLRRTFTLLEAADLLRETDVRDLARLPLDERARELGVRLDTRRAQRKTSDSDDIEDPIGRRTAIHDQVADTIATALLPLLSVLVPAPSRRPGAHFVDGLPTGS